MSFGISQMEHEREDIDAPLFMAWRIEIMPFKDIEIGLSRTAQFCGEQLECTLECVLEHAHRKRQRRHRRDGGERARQPDGGFRPSLEFADRQLAVRPLRADTSARTNRATCLRSTSRSSAWRCGSRWRMAGWCRGSSNTPPPPVRRAPIAVLTTTAPTTRADSTSRAIAITGASSDIPPIAMPRTTRSAAPSLRRAARSGRPRRARHGSIATTSATSRNTVASVPTDYDSLEFGWRGRLFGEQHRCGSRRRIDRARRRRTRRAALRLRSLDPRVRAVRIRARWTWLLALLATAVAGLCACRSVARARR